INIEEQKKYLYNSLSMYYFNYYFKDEFYKIMKNVISTNELVKGVEDIVSEESTLIRNGSIIVLKHVSTGKYLSSLGDLKYTTGSKTQPVMFFYNCVNFIIKC